MKKLSVLFLWLLPVVFCIAETPSSPAPNETQIDSTIVEPEEFYSTLDSLIYSYYYTRQARRGNCEKNDTQNVDFPDSVYMRRLQDLPYEVQMPYNQTVQSVINRYLQRRRNQVEYMMGLGQYYFPIFEEILAKYGVPDEMKYLPVIESAMNTTIVSRAGAAGLWQFMPSTGRAYGLEVNSMVDERCDPIKSTHAAARYLKDLHKIYNDWHLAIAAYNCGPGNVNKAMRRSGGKQTYWGIYPYLPAETRGYVPIFIAANYVMNYYQYHNLCPAEIDLPDRTDTVQIAKRLYFRQVSEVLGISIDELRALNPQYRKNIVPESPEKKYYLKLPHNYAVEFIAQKDSIFAYKAEEFAALAIKEAAVEQQIHKQSFTHRVKSGETLGGIANRYRVKVNDIKRWNGLKSNTIRIGQRLVIRK